MEELALDEAKNVVRFKADDRIITENEISQKMYIITKGKARVFKTYMGQRITLAVLGKGELFGELSFIDAHPRSASVEALTDMEAIEMDGAHGVQQLKVLPAWVWSIFRTVFHRFRELDRQITTLQSAISYRKKGMKEDIIASTIYLELVRFLKVLDFVQLSHEQKKIHPEQDAFIAELDGLLGNRAIGLKPFWKSLVEYDYIDREVLRKKNTVKLMPERLKEFAKYLRIEIERERYLILSHGAISILRHLMSALDREGRGEDPTPVDISAESLRLSNMPNYEAAEKELVTCQIVPFKDGVFTADSHWVHKLYVYQSILKVFDHSAMYVD